MTQGRLWRNHPIPGPCAFVRVQMIHFNAQFRASARKKLHRGFNILCVWYLDGYARLLDATFKPPFSVLSEDNGFIQSLHDRHCYFIQFSCLFGMWYGSGSEKSEDQYRHASGPGRPSQGVALFRHVRSHSALHSTDLHFFCIDLRSR